MTCPLFVIPREAVNVAANDSGCCGNSRCRNPDWLLALASTRTDEEDLLSCSLLKFAVRLHLSLGLTIFSAGAPALPTEFSSYKFRQKCGTEAVQR